MAKNILDKCALCGKSCNLTFEHIPPESAFNNSPARPVTADKLLGKDKLPWDIEGLRYINQQQGLGRYSLCSKCNNNTGSWYGDEYVKFAYSIACAFSDLKVYESKAIGLEGVHPLRFIKQVISMFCSINGYCDDTRFEDLRNFVLDKHAKGLDKLKYKVCMYFTKSSFSKHVPLTVVGRLVNGKYESIAVSEISAYPLGFILYFNPIENWEYNGVDITDFAECEYDRVVNVESPWVVYEINDYFPLYYRTKEEVVECRKKNNDNNKNGTITE